MVCSQGVAAFFRWSWLSSSPLSLSLLSCSWLDPLNYIIYAVGIWVYNCCFTARSISVLFSDSWSSSHHHMDLHTKGKEMLLTICLSDVFYLIVFEEWLLWSYVFFLHRRMSRRVYSVNIDINRNAWFLFFYWFLSSFLQGKKKSWVTTRRKKMRKNKFRQAYIKLQLALWVAFWGCAMCIFDMDCSHLSQMIKDQKWDRPL